jgi:uncharacterized protein (TIGR00730 family)
MIKRICIFCGANAGGRAEYAEVAGELGRTMARLGLEIVYGGSSVGLMPVLANAALQAGGRVIGVIPALLVERELAHQGLTDLRIVGSMHERKATMAELADAFVAMPGGLGTLDEIFEMLTWSQLGLHAKPCAFLNVASYYTKLLEFLEHARRAGFIRDEHHARILAAEDIESLLVKLGVSLPP